MEKTGNLAPRWRSPRFLSKTLAVAAMSFVAAVSSAEAKTVDLHEAVPAGKMRQLKDLPGFDRHVQLGQLEQLEDSTLKVYSSFTTPAGGTVTRDCSGNKIDYAGVDYVASAAHCFVGNMQSYNAGLLGPRQGNKKALDFIGNFQSVTIKDMNQPVSLNGSTQYERPDPMADAAGVSIGLRRGDDALLAINPTVMSSGRSFDRLSTLSYKPAINRPELGQQVAIYGAPAPDDIGIAAIGRYLGRMNYAPVRNQLLDMVAIRAKGLNDDPCQPGSSGSSAVTADGHMFGGLSFGLELDLAGYSTDERPRPGYYLDPYQSLSRIERSLNVSVPTGFDQICMYAVRDAQSMPDLVGGFGVYAASGQ